jgi:hypothetical protein
VIRYGGVRYTGFPSHFVCERRHNFLAFGPLPEFWIRSHILKICKFEDISKSCRASRLFELLDFNSTVLELCWLVTPLCNVEPGTAGISKSMDVIREYMLR